MYFCLTAEGFSNFCIRKLNFNQDLANVVKQKVGTHLTSFFQSGGAVPLSYELWQIYRYINNIAVSILFTLWKSMKFRIVIFLRLQRKRLDIQDVWVQNSHAPLKAVSNFCTFPLIHTQSLGFFCVVNIIFHKSRNIWFKQGPEGVCMHSTDTRWYSTLAL